MNDSLHRIPLTPGATLERELAGGGADAYTLALETGGYAHVVVIQKGIDVALRLFTPGGELLTYVDSPTGATGAEVVSVVAEAAGAHHLEVVSEDPAAAPGLYELRLEGPRPSSSADRTRVAAERAFHRGEDLRRARRWAEALPHYEEALEGWREAADREGEAQALYRLGWMHDELGDPAAAEEPYRTALTFYRQSGDEASEAALAHRLGRVLMDLDRLEEAEELLHRAVGLFRGLSNLEGHTGALERLGDVYKWTARVRQAFAAYEESQALRARSGDRRAQATLELGLGDLYLSQNRLQEAHDRFEHARQLARELGELSVEAVALRRLGDVLQRLGRLEEARRHLERSLTLRRESGDRRGEAVTLGSLGTVLLEAGDLEGAEDRLEQALGLFRDLGDAHGEAMGLHKLGQVAWGEGNPKRAHELHAAALPLLEKTGDRASAASARYGAGRALRALGKTWEAKEMLEAAAEATEQLRSEPARHDLRLSYFASRQHYWALLIDTLMELHREHPESGFDAQAFLAAEKARARDLLDRLAEAGADLRRDADPALVAREMAIQEQLNLLELNRLRRREEGATEEALAPLDTEERRLLDDLARVRSKITTASPRYPELGDSSPIHLPTLRRLLGDDTLLLAYSLGEERSFLWLLSGHGERTVRGFDLPPRRQIESQAREVRALLQQVSHVAQPRRERALRQLSRTLLGPVAGDLGGKRLLIAADGALHQLPFAALADPASDDTAKGELVYLLEHHEVLQLPSASVLATLREQTERREPAKKWLAVLADPVFRADDPRLSGGSSPAPAQELPEDLTRAAEDLELSEIDRLPGTGKEARAILELLPEGSAFLAEGLAADREAVLGGGLADYRILHFATHGLVHPRHAELSGLVLSLVDARGEPRDGFLRLYEISNLDLSADLAVLSACETGLGEEVAGEGLVGLTRGFMAAGVPRLVVSLWRIGDAGTAELMHRFYELHLKHGLAPARALRQAQLTMLESDRWSQPRHWAGFVFEGDWTPRPRSPDEPLEPQDTGTTTTPKERLDTDLPGPPP